MLIYEALTRKLDTWDADTHTHKNIPQPACLYPHPYLHVCACLCTHPYLHVCACLCVCMHACAGLCVSVHVHVHACMHVYACMCACVCMPLCMRACLCVHVCVPIPPLPGCSLFPAHAPGCYCLRLPYYFRSLHHRSLTPRCIPRQRSD